MLASEMKSLFLSRDYFYVADRHGNWERQRTLYQVLQASPSASPAELRLAFKLRDLEVRASRASKNECRALERAFNILAQEELRACYDALLKDPLAPAVFPYGGFGSILVAGERSRKGDAFFTKDIITFLPEQRYRHFRAPLRRCDFYNDHAIYRDLSRKLEVCLDPCVLPFVWDATWNQWKHLLGTKAELKATFVLLSWGSAPTSRRHRSRKKNFNASAIHSEFRATSTSPRLPGAPIMTLFFTNSSLVARELSIYFAMSTSLTLSAAWLLRLPS